MKDVGAVAGVSLATVSRVLNGEDSVRAELADKVRAAVILLGYRRDLTATNLRRADRHSASIGVVVEDVSDRSTRLLRGIETVARRRGVLPLVGSSDEDGARERELAEAFLARRVDGLVVVPSGRDHSYLQPERDAGVAVVFVDRPPAHIDADCALSDNAGGAFAAAAHLLAAGHRRVGFLGGRETIFTARERLRGYRRALAANRLPFDPALVRMGLHDSRAASEAAGEAAPTAVASAQDVITIGTVDRLRTLDLHSTVALVGFDDLVLADAVDPALTVVAQDGDRLGQAAAELLFARLDRGAARRVVVLTTLLVRGSGELRR